MTAKSRSLARYARVGMTRDQSSRAQWARGQQTGALLPARSIRHVCVTPDTVIAIVTVLVPLNVMTVCVETDRGVEPLISGVVTMSAVIVPDFGHAGSLPVTAGRT